MIALAICRLCIAARHDPNPRAGTSQDGLTGFRFHRNATRLTGRGRWPVRKYAVWWGRRAGQLKVREYPRLRMLLILREEYVRRQE
jgi:hypothetical protein